MGGRDRYCRAVKTAEEINLFKTEKNGGPGSSVHMEAEISGVSTAEAECARLYGNVIGGTRVKRKLTVGLMFTIALVLLAAAALATALLTWQEILEQVAVPMAQEDGPKDGAMRVYTAEELAKLVQALSENGFTLEENNIIVQAIKNGNGYYADETIMEICRQAFGGLIGTWTIEEQDWYDCILYECGCYEEYKPNLPEEDNMTYEEAEAFAFSALKKKYGEDLAPEDRTVYRLERFFYREEGEAFWNFNLTPLDLEHGRYTVMFSDRDPEGTLELSGNVLSWQAGSYTGYDVMTAMWQIYGGSENVWLQEAWQKMHEKMTGASLEEDASIRKYRGYQLTSYPDPAEGEITREEAVRAAEAAVDDDKAALDSAVFTEYEGRRAWMVGLVTGKPMNEWDEGVTGLYAVTVDSVTGKAENVRKGTEDDDKSMAFVPQEAYEKAGEGLLQRSDYIRIAVDAVKARYPDQDVLDGTEYQIVYYGSGQGAEVHFRTRNCRHGNVDVSVSRDGKAVGVTADLTKPEGDSLYDRYRAAYGYISDWDQEVWTRLDKDMEPLEPRGIGGRLLKLEHYPEENTVSIGKEQAKDLAVKASGKRTAEAFTCVLIDAQPHPVWKMLVMSAHEHRVVELDAETGEIVSREPYKIDYTPQYELFSLEKDRRALEMEDPGPEAIARREVTYAFADLNDDASEPQVEESEYYETVRDGLTVRFLSKRPGMKSYLVEFGEDGYVLRCEETDDVSAARDNAE